MADYTTYPINDTDYDAEAAQLFNATRVHGVYANDHFNATVTGVDNSVTIAPGLAWARRDEWGGVVFASKTPVKVDLPLADPSQTRWDLITIQFNSNRGFAGELDFIQGTPSSNPNYPEISQNNSVFELALYAVRRNVGAVTITAADIIDLRIDEQYCGIMRDGVTGIDTTVIVDRVDETLAQLTAQGNATIEALDEALQSVLDRNGLMLKSEYADQPNVVNEAKVSQDAQEHIAQTDNPHGVTAEQAGALPLAGGKLTGALFSTSAVALDKYISLNEDGFDPLSLRMLLGYGKGFSGVHCSPEGIIVTTTGELRAQTLSMTGWVPCRASSFPTSSSIRYKKDVTDITNEQALKLLEMRPRQYVLKDSDEICYGFIAEEVNKVDDTYVVMGKNLETGEENVVDALNYNEYIAPLIKLVQMQQMQIDALEKKLEV